MVSKLNSLHFYSNRLWRSFFLFVDSLRWKQQIKFMKGNAFQLRNLQEILTRMLQVVLFEFWVVNMLNFTTIYRKNSP